MSKKVEHVEPICGHSKTPSTEHNFNINFRLNKMLD